MLVSTCPISVKFGIRKLHVLPLHSVKIDTAKDILFMGRKGNYV
jgi:hypothetical protein